ncbi:MAG: magnesium transporter [Candidatus Bathyarchaeota archaeon]|nr:magnesium transporter [Candidatus Bathyarchaeota archaeon]MDW8040176.1 magnesium transporter [Nitrososphaerota archaeon]
MTLDSKPNFTKTLKQSVIAYAFNVFGIAAGTIIAYYSGLFQRAPWAVVIYPPILSARGVIGGLFCGRLSTALHLGIVQPRFLGNTKSFYLLFQAVVFLTFEASLLMGLVAVLFRALSYDVFVGELWDMVNVLVATMALALMVISPLTLTVSFLSFKRGLDPDIILYPVESTVSDFLITAIYISVLNVYLTHGSFWYFLSAVSLTLLFTAFYILVRNMREPEFTKTLRESLLTLIVVAFIINIAGTVLGRVDELIRERQEVYEAYPVYVVYPALIDTIGDVGSVVGSTATTKLALGTLKASFSSIKNHFTEISGAWTASIMMYFAYSILALIIGGMFSPLNVVKFSLLLLTVNVLAAALIILVAYSVAIITYQKGLDPDNFEIPIESSLADALTTISLLVALTFWVWV